MDLNQKAKSILEFEDGKICNHCLGRQFARLGHGMENFERGRIIREALEKGKEIHENDFKKENAPDNYKYDPEDCNVCKGIFSELEKHLKYTLKALERYDFDTFLIGCRLPGEAIQEEERLWEEVGLHNTEPMKSEFNRLIGKRIEKKLDATVDFERPDINAVIEIEKERVELQVNSLLIYGEYNKYKRGIPQTNWPCNNCKGEGCEKCNWTGKQYQESVEELIAEPVIEEAKGIESKFHGSGREDVDAKCLGKRPFVLEILEPEERNLNLKKLQEKINKENEDKIEVFNLEFTHKDKIEEIKERKADKTYRIVLELGKEVSEEEMENLKEIKGTIKQRTPTRVEHRRAGKIRKREVKDISWKKIGEKKIELKVKGEAGLYIKELATGDKDKTEPSVAQILDTDVEWIELDVLEVEK